MLDKDPYEFLQDGDLVLVNGTEGYIELIKQETKQEITKSKNSQ
jgi:hypothetical protein